MRTTSITSGHRAVGEGRVRQLRHHVVARRPAPVLDVLDEHVVEEREGPRAAVPVERTGGVRLELGSAASSWSCFGHPEQIGDVEQRERMRVRLGELARAVTRRTRR